MISVIQGFLQRSNMLTKEIRSIMDFTTPVLLVIIILKKQRSTVPSNMMAARNHQYKGGSRCDILVYYFLWRDLVELSTSTVDVIASKYSESAVRMFVSRSIEHEIAVFFLSISSRVYNRGVGWKISKSVPRDLDMKKISYSLLSAASETGNFHRRYK